MHRYIRTHRFQLGILIVVSGLVVVLLYKLGTLDTKKPLDVYAREVIAACQTAGHTPSCYDREIPKLLQTLTMEEAFEVTRIVQKHDPRYLYCHVLAHNISSSEVAKDPDSWRDVLTRCPMTMCNNGCPHGALMERFAREALMPDQIEGILPELNTACEPRDGWNPTEVERSMCYHGIGHLLMYVTGADLTESAGLCRRIGIKDDGRDYVQTCTEATAMSVFQPLEPEDVALVQDIAPTTKDEVQAFCDQYRSDTMLYHACHRESWPQFLDTIRADPGALVSFCAYTDDEVWQRTCYGTVMNILTIYLVVEHPGDLSGLATYCDGLPVRWKAVCYRDAASRLLQIDPQYRDTSLAVCQLAASAGLGDDCYKGLLYYASYSFHAGSQALTTYCAGFPQDLQRSCTGQTVKEAW